MHAILNIRKSPNPHLCSHFHENKRFKHTLKQEMSLKKTNGVGLKKEENITQARFSTCT